MGISMELSVYRSFVSASPAILCPHSSNFVFYSCFFRRRRYCESFKWKSKTISQITLCVERDCSSNGEDEADCADFWGDSEFVEVMGIGSRKDAILDFCLDSPFQFSSLRFWNVLSQDSLNVQLQQRILGRDITPKIVEAPLSLQSSSKAIILVASAGYGLDHITAINILRTARSANGFAVAIILKPFSFEGRRRQDEVRDLVGKLHEHSNFYIDIDMDTLLEKDVVTLDEALKTANSAVLWAINAIYVLISETQKKFSVVQRNNSNYLEEIKVSEVIKILDSYKEAKLGYGAGYNFETSILQAINDCPFLGVGLKDLNGIVICVLASSVDIGLHDPLRTFRQTTNYTREIIISTIHDPNLEPNMVVTTVVVLGCIEQEPAPKSSILSRLAQSFPLVLNFLRKHHAEPYTTQGNDATENVHVTKVIHSPESGESANRVALNEISEGFDKHSEEIDTVLSSNEDDYVMGNQNSEFEQREVGLLEAKSESSNFYDQLSEGPFQREQLISWNLGPGYQIAQEWAKERAVDFGTTTILADNLSIFHLPVGVRPSKDLKDGANISSATQNQDPKSKDDVKKQPLVNSSMSSWGALSDVNFEAGRELYNNASTLLKAKYVDASKKQGVLSVRAASMLEAERDSPKKWSPTLEMQYRGGVYRGHCQGGLPEGKGQLVLGDGNIYDGVWRYGKRSGLGTFYFNNGDVLQGSWRDDIMHGKGWFYFHTGDRWFANFWKGKANGEGRFYSKSGDIFFGHFQDGWRHGCFLCIKVDGARCIEVWDQGVLVDRKEVSDTGAG